MRGFEYTLHNKMQNIHPQLMIRALAQDLDVEKITAVIRHEFPEIAVISPMAMEYAIIKSAETEPTVVLMKGINPLYEAQVSAIGTKVYGAQKVPLTLGDTVYANKILIGKTLAENMNVAVGNMVDIYYTNLEDTRSKRLSLESMPAEIGGFFESGVDEFDTGVIFSSLEFLQSLFPETGINQINLKLICDADETAVVARLHERLHLPILSWKDLYPALVSALKLEKYAMFFILALITLVASMCIVALLFMQITQKRPDIAILSALGTSQRTISRIFVLMGMSIALSASMVGVIFALLASWLLEKYPFIQLPDAYYVSHLPAKMEPSIIVAVLATTCVLSFLATWIPTRSIRRINISHILRFEG